MAGKQKPGKTNHKWEVHYKHRKVRGSDSTAGTPGTGDSHWKNGERSPVTCGFENQWG